MPSSPPPDATGIVPWPKGLDQEYIAYLETSSTNRSVLTGMKRVTILNHLRSPMGRPPVEYSRQERIQFANEKYNALQHYEIQDS